MTAVEYAVVSTASVENESALVSLGSRLLKTGIKILTTTAEAHECFVKASIPHEHVIRAGTRLIGHLEDAKIVVGSLLPILRMNNTLTPANSHPEQQAIVSLIRAAALDPENCVVLTNPIQYPLVYEGFSAVPVSTRKTLSIEGLLYLSKFDELLAKSLRTPMLKDEGQKVVVVGFEASAEAFSQRIAESPMVREVVLIPGGPRQLPKVRPISPPSLENTELTELIAKEKPSLVVVCGASLESHRLCDSIRLAGVPCFGLGSAASQLGCYESFAKSFFQRFGIPTSRGERFNSYITASEGVKDLVGSIKLVGSHGMSSVVENPQRASDILSLWQEKYPTNDLIFCEEVPQGERISLSMFCDGTYATLFPAVEVESIKIGCSDVEHHAAAFAPSKLSNPSLLCEIQHKIIQPMVDAAGAEGLRLCGVLTLDILITAEGPLVVGTSSSLPTLNAITCLPLLETDAYFLLTSCVTGTLRGCCTRFDKKLYSAAMAIFRKEGVTVDLKSLGASSLEEDGILYQVLFENLRDLSEKDILAGTGLVLVVCTQGNSMKEAVTNLKTLAKSNRVTFDGAIYVENVGENALRAPLRVGVLGSTRGTDLQYIIDAIDKGWLFAEINIVVSNKKDAYIVTRASNHDLNVVVHSMKGCNSRSEFDAQVTATLKEYNVDLILLIGYMRILSDDFVDEWFGRVLNVHPSLLPEFAGGMDLNVHQAVIDAKRDVTGCTIHLVTKEVDGGPIIVQRRCPVYHDDDSDKLKARVQGMEGPAFVEAIYKFVKNKNCFEIPSQQ